MQFTPDRDTKRISYSTCHVFLCDRRTSKIFEAGLIRPSNRTAVQSPQQEAGQADLHFLYFTFYHLVTNEVKGCSEVTVSYFTFISLLHIF